MPDIYLTRLIALRDIGFPLAKQKEAEGHLVFNLFRSTCGTYGCVLGWWATTEYAKKDGWYVIANTPYWGSEWLNAAESYFNITSGDWVKLFDTDPDNTLADRKTYLDKLIARRSPQKSHWSSRFIHPIASFWNTL